MKFSALTLVFAATGALSLAIEKRDLATVQTALANVQTGVDSLDTAVKAFKTDPKPVTDAATKLTATINTGNTAVKASSALSFNDAVNLITPVQTLKTHAQTLTADLKAQKANIQTAKQCDVVRTQLTNINTASQALINTVVSKVPDSAKDIAADQAQGITDTLTDAQNAFSTANCKNAA